MYIKASRGDELIGIWWYTDEDQIWAKSCPVDEGILDGNYIQYSDKQNHLNLWNNIVSENISDLQEKHNILKIGYRGFERGRVVYDTLTQCYVITCSKDLVNNKQFRKDIVEYFQLKYSRYEFLPLNH